MKTIIKDINGKVININDIVVIHNIIGYAATSPIEEYNSAIGEIGIVTGFGCVSVQIARSHFNDTIKKYAFLN